jgi:hypothetical protein
MEIWMWISFGIASKIKIKPGRKEGAIVVSKTVKIQILPFYAENISVSTIRIFNIKCPKHLMTFCRQIRILAYKAKTTHTTISMRFKIYS